MSGDADREADADLREEPRPEPPDFSALRNSLQEHLTTSRATAVAAAVWIDGHVYWVGGFGTADIRGETTPDEQTQFLVGEGTQAFTSLAYAQRVAAGQASLQTTPRDVLSGLSLPDALGFVSATAHDLMTHQSGISQFQGELMTSTSDEDLREYLYGDFRERAYSMAPAGVFHNRAIPNDAMLAMMTQELEGRPWADIANEDVFAPLGMTRTVARKSEVDINRAVGIGVAGTGESFIRPVSLWETWEDAFVRPSMMVWSTPMDLMRFVDFLMDGAPEVLPDMLRERMVTGHAPQQIAELPGEFGYGIKVRRGFTNYPEHYDVETWSLEPDSLTHTTTMYALPEQRFAICIMSNTISDSHTASLTLAVEEHADLPEPGALPALPFEPDELDALTGTYEDPFAIGEVVIAREEDILTIKLPSLDISGTPYETELQPISTNMWRAQIAQQFRTLRFIEGDNDVMYLVSQSWVAARQDTPFMLRAPSQGDPARLERLLSSPMHDSSWRMYEPAGPRVSPLH